jgi:hypothetical protein
LIFLGSDERLPLQTQLISHIQVSKLTRASSIIGCASTINCSRPSARYTSGAPSQESMTCPPAYSLVLCCTGLFHPICSSFVAILWVFVDVF